MSPLLFLSVCSKFCFLGSKPYQVRTPDEVWNPGLIVSVEDFEWFDSDFFAIDFRETREPNELIFDLNIMSTVFSDHRQLTIEHNVRFRPCGQGWISGIELPQWTLLNINQLVVLQHYQMSTFCPHFVPIHQYWGSKDSDQLIFYVWRVWTACYQFNNCLFIWR